MRDRNAEVERQWLLAQADALAHSHSVNLPCPLHCPVRMLKAGIHSGHSLWHWHPHVRSDKQLTLGERAADAMRNGFGSWTFVFAFMGFLVVWMALNGVGLVYHWDKYPYILLNLCLSCLAALQGALILIAAKRADRVAAEQATAHYTETHKLDELLEQNTQMTNRIEKLTGIIHEHIMQDRRDRALPLDIPMAGSTGGSVEGSDRICRGSGTDCGCSSSPVEAAREDPGEDSTQARADS